MFTGTKVSKKNEVISTPNDAAAAPVVASPFKVFKQKEFHDSRTCEYPFCTTKFWGLGNRHHCRMCGLSVCTTHCRSEAKLSTRNLPVYTVDESQLASMSNQILASGKNSLPEALVFRRACLECCRKAKIDEPGVSGYGGVAGIATTTSVKGSGKEVSAGAVTGVEEEKNQEKEREAAESDTETEMDIPQLDLVDIQHDEELQGFASQDSVENDLGVTLEPLSTKEVTIIEEEVETPKEDPLAKEMAALAKAQQLLNAATLAEVKAEELAFGAERVAFSVEQTGFAAEESAKSAKVSASEVDHQLGAMEAYRARAEEQNDIADKALVSTSEKVAVVEQNRMASAAHIQAADDELAAERARIEKELAALDAKASESEKAWEKDESSKVSRTAQRSTFAQERAALIAQLSVATAEREKKAVEHVAAVKKHTEVSEAYEHASTASAAEASATSLQEDAPATEPVRQSAQASKDAADKSKASAERAAEAKVEVRTAVESAEVAAANSAEAAVAVKTADAECVELGVVPTPNDVNNADRVARRTQRCTEAVQRVDASAERITMLNDEAQENALQAASVSEKIVASRAAGDAAVVRTTKASEDATAEAARARAIETDSIKFAEAALSRSRQEATASIASIDEARSAATKAENEHKQAKDEEVEHEAAKSAEIARTAAEAILAKQTAAQLKAQELIVAAKQAEAESEESSAAAEKLAVASQEGVLAATEAAKIVKASVGTVDGERVTMEEYRNRAEELSATADQALLATSLEANVSEEHALASTHRIQAADEELVAENATIEEALAAHDAQVAKAESQWEAEATPEVDRAAQRAVFAQQRVDLLSKRSAAASKREQQAMEHLAIVKAHTEVRDAYEHSSTASAAEARATSLRENTRTTATASQTARAGQEAAENSKVAAQRATDSKVAVRAAVKEAELKTQRSVEADIEVRAAISECEEVGATAPQYDSKPADHKKRWSAAIERVDASAEQVIKADEETQKDAQYVAAVCGQAIAARTVGDMAVVRTADSAEEAASEAARARAAEAEMISAAEVALGHSRSGASTSAKFVDDARSSVAEAESHHAKTKEDLAASAAEALLARQSAAQHRAQELIAAAKSAEAKAEESSATAERAGLSSQEVALAAEESAQAAKASAGEVDGELVVMDEYRVRAEEQKAVADASLLSTTQKANASVENFNASAERIRVADEQLAAENKSIQEALVAHDATVKKAEARWETDGVADVDRAAQRVSFAQKRAELVAQLSVAASKREDQAAQHVRQANAHTEAQEAVEYSTAASSAESRAVLLREGAHTTEPAVLASSASKASAERAATSAKRAAEGRGEVRAAVKVAEDDETHAAEAVAAAHVAIAECKELGATAPEEDADYQNRVALRSQRRAVAVEHADASADRADAASEEAKQNALHAESVCGQIVSARAVGDKAVLRTTDASAEAAREAARARQAEADMIAAADAALLQSRNSATASTERVEALHAAAEDAKNAHAKAQEVEAARKVAEAAEIARIAAEELSARQKAATLKAVQLVAEAKAAELNVEEATANAQHIAVSLEATLHSAETDAAIAHSTIAVVEQEAVVMESYRSHTDDFKATATQAKLDAALEANVSEENCVASEQRIEAADEELATEREAIAQAVAALDAKLADAEAQWQTEELSEHERTAQRVNFAQEKADLLGKVSVAEALREKKAEEHVAIVRAHTEVEQAHQKAGVAAAAAAGALELQQNTHSTDKVKDSAHAGQNAAERVKATAKRSAEAKVEVRVSVVAVQRAVEESAHASALAKVAIVECEEIGAESPAFDVIPAKNVDQRCSDAVKRVDASAERVFHLKEASEQDSRVITVRCGQAVAARIVGDMTVTHTADVSEKAAREADRAREAHEDCVSFAEVTLGRTSTGVRASNKIVNEALSAAAESENAHIAATEAEEARLAAETAEQARIAAETLSTKQNAARNKVLELLIAAHAAEKSVEELTAAAEQLALTVEGTVLSAEADAAISERTVNVVDAEYEIMVAYRAQVEEKSIIADNSRVGASIEANVSLENCTVSLERIEAADTVVLAERASYEVSLRILADKMEAMHEQWETTEVSESEQAAQRVELARERVDAMVKLSSAESAREQKAVEHTQWVRNHTEVTQAQEHAELAAAAALVAVELQHHTSTTEKVTSAARLGHEASDRVKATSQRAAVAKVEVRSSVEAVHRAVEQSAQTSAAAKIAIAECDELGAESPEFDVQQTSDVDKRCSEAIRRVDTSAERVFELTVASEEHSQYTSERCGQAVAARVVGDMAVVHAHDLSLEAATEAARARAAQEDMVAVAEAALNRAEDSVRLARENVSVARANTVQAESALIAAKEAEAARLFAEAAERARTAAEILAAKQLAARNRALELLAAAEVAEDKADKLSFESAILASALSETLLSAEADAAIAESAVGVVDGELVTMETYRTRAEELSALAEKAQLGACLEANVSEENCEASDVRVRIADDDLAVERTQIEEALLRLRGKKSGAEERWQAEGVAETVRAAQRIPFAQHRAEYLSKLSAAETNREQIAVEHVSIVRAHTEVTQAQEQAAAAAVAATDALNLQHTTHSTEKVRATAHSGHEAAVRVNFTSLRAVEAKEEVRASVQAAERAEAESAKAAAAAQAAVEECVEVGVECPEYDGNHAQDVSERNQRCVEAIQRVDTSADRVFILKEAADKNSTKATAGCGQAVAARTVGDLAIARAAVASEEAAREAARARSAHVEMITFAEDAMARALDRTKSSVQATESARIAVSEAEAALVAAKEAEAARVAAEIAEKARTEAEILAAKQRAAQLRAEELVAAALAAEENAEKTAADAKGISLHLNQTLLSAETDATLAQNAVVVVEEEALLLENYRARAEELGITAEKAKVGASLEANVSEENCEASDRRVRTADGVLAAERSSVDKSLEHLRARKNAAKERWQHDQTKETARLSQLAGFAQERSTMLGKLSAAESNREQKALEHVSIVRAHNEVAQAHEQATIATSAANSAVELQQLTHSSEKAKSAAHAGQEAAQRVGYTAQRAVAAKAEVRVAVETATQAAARSVEATAAAKAAIAECEELNCAYPDFHINRSGAVTPRNLRCSEAINRVDVSAERVFLLKESSKQDSQQATARCGQAVAARTVGDMAVARATHASDEANREAARARNAHATMIAFADSALTRCQKGASSSSEAWEESRVAAAEAERVSLALEESERQREVNEAAEKAEMAARAHFKKQQAALAYMREQTEAARIAEASAEKWTLAVENIVISLDKTLESAEEANASSSEAVGIAQVEALSFEEYRARAEDTHMVVRNALYATSVEANMSEENCKASQLHIQTSDDVLVAEHATIEEELGLLGEPVLRDNDEESVSLWSAQRATIAQKISALMTKMLSAAQRREEQAREHISHVRGRTHANVAKDKAAYATDAASTATHKKHTARSVENVTKVTHMSNLAADKASAATRRAADAKVELRVAMERSTKAAEMYMLAASSAKATIKACEESGASSPRYDRNAVEIVAKHTQRRTDAARRVNEQADQIFSLSKRTQHSTQKATGLCNNALAAKAEGDANVARSVEGSKEANTVATRARQAEAEMIAAAEAALVRSHEYVRTSRQAVEESRTAAAEAENARVAAEAAAQARRNSDPRYNRYEMRSPSSQYRFEQPNSPDTQFTNGSRQSTSHPLYTRKESRNTMTMRQAAQERVEGLRITLRNATASAEEWTFTAERIAYSLDQTVLTAEEATDAVRESAGMVDTELAAMKKFLSRAEKISATAYDALYATSVETNACEEGKRASAKRINIADGVLRDERASVEEELRLLDETVSAGSALDSTVDASKNVRAAHKQSYAHDMSKLVSRMFAAAVRREKQAMEHVAMARNHSKAEHAHEKAAVAATAATEATRLQQKVSGTERLNRATKACVAAAERASTAAEKANEAKVEVRVAVEAASKAVEAAMQASRDLQTWRAECEMLGVDFSRGEHNNMEDVTWYTKRCNDATRRVNESADHVTMLRGLTQDSANQASAQSRQANSARSEAELTVSRVLDASREASEIAFRARQIESETIAAAEAALVRARSEAKPAREAVLETRTATADVDRAHDHAEKSLVAKNSAEKMEYARAARDRVLKLVAAARDAESVAEQKSFAAERVAFSLVAVLQQAVDASIATAEVDEKVQEDASAMAAFSAQAESMLRAAEDARAAISHRVHDCEENSQAYLNRVQRADEAFAAVRTAIEKELVTLDKTVATAEQRWETEGTADALQSSQRASFAQQRNGLNARLAAAAAIREEKILDILSQAKGHSEVTEAQDKASAASAAAAAAQGLEKATRTMDSATERVSNGSHAAEKANSAAQRATEAKAEVRAAVVEADRAATLAAETAAAARQAIAECDDNKEEFAEVTFSSADDISRRVQRCHDATQRVTESANHVSVLCGTARQSLEHASDVLKRAVAARAAGESAVARTSRAAKEATEEANRARDVEVAMIGSAEAALARSQEVSRSLKRTV